MEERGNLNLDRKTLKSILCNNYIKMDYKINQEVYDTAELEIKFLEIKEHKKVVQFIIKYIKTIDSLSLPIVKEYIISQDELNNIINDNLSSEGYEIDTFDYDVDKNDKSFLNSIEYKLKKKEKVKTKKRGWKRNV